VCELDPELVDVLLLPDPELVLVELLLVVAGTVVEFALVAVWVTPAIRPSVAMDAAPAVDHVAMRMRLDSGAARRSVEGRSVMTTTIGSGGSGRPHGFVNSVLSPVSRSLRAAAGGADLTIVDGDTAPHERS
jgi:hypothetical protein